MRLGSRARVFARLATPRTRVRTLGREELGPLAAGAGGAHIHDVGVHTVDVNVERMDTCENVCKAFKQHASKAHAITRSVNMSDARGAEGSASNSTAVRGSGTDRVSGNLTSGSIAGQQSAMSTGSTRCRSGVNPVTALQRSGQTSQGSQDSSINTPSKKQHAAAWSYGVRPPLSGRVRPSTMGARVLSQRRTLAERLASLAEAIRDCDYLLIGAGAGFSADSGLAVYKDIADVPAYRALGLTYATLCTPLWLHRNPNIFYGFWGSCFNSYRDTEPHPGYYVIKKILESFAATKQMFVYSSNVDSHFEKTGISRDRVYEFHGTCMDWQCSKPCCASAVFRLPYDHRFCVNSLTMLAPPDDGPHEADQGRAENSGLGINTSKPSTVEEPAYSGTGQCADHTWPNLADTRSATTNTGAFRSSDCVPTNTACSSASRPRQITGKGGVVEASASSDVSAWHTQRREIDAIPPLPTRLRTARTESNSLVISLGANTLQLPIPLVERMHAIKRIMSAQPNGDLAQRISTEADDAERPSSRKGHHTNLVAYAEPPPALTPMNATTINIDSTSLDGFSEVGSEHQARDADEPAPTAPRNTRYKEEYTCVRSVLSAPQNHPRCPRCGSYLRPRVLMFDDEQFIERHDEEQRYRSFRKNLYAARGKKICLLEMGCGLRIPTVRNDFERILRRTTSNGNLTTLYRVNVGDKRIGARSSGVKDRICRIATGAMHAMAEVSTVLFSGVSPEAKANELAG